MLFQTCQLGVEEIQILRKMANQEVLSLQIHQGLSGPRLTRALTQPTRPKAFGKAAAAMHSAYPWKLGAGPGHYSHLFPQRLSARPVPTFPP